MKWLTGDNVLGDFDDVGLLAELGWVVIFILGEVQTSTTAWVNVLNNEKMLMLLKKKKSCWNCCHTLTLRLANLGIKTVRSTNVFNSISAGGISLKMATELKDPIIYYFMTSNTLSCQLLFSLSNQKLFCSYYTNYPTSECNVRCFVALGERK